MPRTLLQACMLFACVLFAWADASVSRAQEADFRSVRWGMTDDEVRAAEPNQFIERHSKNPESQMSLVYECSIDGRPCRLYYEFNNRGRLFASYYNFTDVPFDQIYEFDTRLRATLEEKYPKAREDRSTDFWRTETTDIELRAENGHPGVHYTSRKVPAVEDNAGEALPKEQF
ncbi:MAG: hypothetical protein O3A96_01190 [Proteobacteria bacterium]|nr:hypothetical protein [Pseudomonadota bacterium]